MRVPRVSSSLDGARDRRREGVTLTRRAFAAGAIVTAAGVVFHAASDFVMNEASAAPGSSVFIYLCTAPIVASPVAAPQVIIENFTFSPAELTVAVGTEVTWENRDDIPHTVTSEDKTTFASGFLDTGDRFSIRFTTPGTYPYFCSVHPMMTAKVIVQS